MYPFFFWNALVRIHNSRHCCSHVFQKLFYIFYIYFTCILTHYPKWQVKPSRMLSCCMKGNTKAFFFFSELWCALKPRSRPSWNQAGVPHWLQRVGDQPSPRRGLVGGQMLSIWQHRAPEEHQRSADHPLLQFWSLFYVTYSNRFKLPFFTQLACVITNTTSCKA